MKQFCIVLAALIGVTICSAPVKAEGMQKVTPEMLAVMALTVERQEKMWTQHPKNCLEGQVSFCLERRIDGKCFYSCCPAEKVVGEGMDRTCSR